MHKAVRASSLSVLALAIAGCNLKDPTPFDPRDLQRPERTAASDAKSMYMPSLPTTLPSLTVDSSMDSAESDVPPSRRRPVRLKPPSRATTGPALNEQPTLRLSLQEIIHRAVVNSREVKVAGYDPAVAKTRVLEAQAHFDPVFFSKVTYTNQVILSPSSGILPGVNPFSPEVFRTLDSQIGLRQNLPSGGQVELRYDVQRIERVPVSAGQLNPYIVNDLALQITQPLLRSFGYDVNWARVSIARNDYKVSVLDYRKALEENLAEIERDYWQLQEAEQEELIQERLLNLSRETYRILKERLPVDVSRVQLRQAQATILGREAVLIRAKARIFDTSDNIKRRMNDPEFPVSGDVCILPVTAAAELPVHFELQDQIETALLNRFELGQQQIREESATIAAIVARNNLLPKFDIIGSVDVQGPGRNIGDAFGNQGRSDFLGASIGFSLEWPLGNREARSIYRRSQIQRTQAITQYSFLVDQVVEDVKGAVREVQTTWNEIGARRLASFAASDYLLSLEQQRDVGEIPQDPNFVRLLLDAQETLGEAERQEALAVAGYYVAIARLERAKGTLLKYNNIVMEEDRFAGMEQ